MNPKDSSNVYYGLPDSTSEYVFDYETYDTTPASVVQHYNDNLPRFSIKIEKNSRGYNWEVGVSNVTTDSLDRAKDILTSLENNLQELYGDDIKKSSN